MTSCDFEEPELCGWTQSSDDDFDWTMHSGQTPSGYTGPSFDHTYGRSKQGHYMFIETSSPRKSGHAATLLSPVYRSEQGDQCFDLWYHMLGPDGDNVVGSLDIYVKPKGVDMADLAPLFHEEGNKGDRWIRVEVEVPPQDESFQIAIVGKRLESYVSDIAIDDVRLFNCSEVYYENVTTEEMYTTTSIASTTNPTTATVTTRGPSSTPRPSTTGAPTTRRPTRPTTSRPTRGKTTTMTTPVMRKSTTGSTKATRPRPTTSAATTTRTTPTRRPRTTSPRTRRTTESRSKPTVTPRRTRRPWNRRTTRRPWTKRPWTRKPKSSRQPKTTTALTISTTVETKRAADTTSAMTTVYPNTTTSNRRTVTKNMQTTDMTVYNTTMEESNSTEFIPGTGNPIQIKKPEATHTSKILPLILGIVISVVFVIIIVVILAVVWAKKKRRREIEPYDEMEPITKSVSKTSLNLNLVNDYDGIDIMDNE